MKAILLTIALIVLASTGNASTAMEYRQEIQTRWSEIKYNTPEDQQEKAFEELSEYAISAVASYPQSAELLIWKGIVLSTHAGAKGGLGALSLVKDARDSLEQALELNPRALGGSAYTSLGALYYQVPGWPLSFGDEAKAKELLIKALDINPNGIDSNFFYGDFLVNQGQYEMAKEFLDRALEAPDRPDRGLADQGRRTEIQVLLSKI